MELLDTVIVFDGKSGEILNIGKLESVKLEYSWADYVVGGKNYGTFLSHDQPTYVVISEQRHKEELRKCAAAYIDYVSKVTRYMISKVSDDDFESILGTVVGIESILLQRAAEMSLKDEIERTKRIWNLNPAKPHEYNIANEISGSELRNQANKIGTRIK